MMILERRHGESIVITLPTGERVVLTVLDRGPTGQARLGISAPRHVPVMRSELLERRKEAQP